ncbi:MAG: MaoC family dehydratase N-terminal domain-containing protein [Acidimicrobiaceae bacterium]|nr:MaoC family dehydratase N-terminal domain-containing protein [Acidimicrobiaceae bacterium]
MTDDNALDEQASPERAGLPENTGLPERTGLPAHIAALIGEPQYPETATFSVEMSYAYNTLSATENGNPLYWKPDVADRLTHGMTMPVSTLSLWMRPHRWEPGATTEQVALKAHFDLKEQLDLPEAIMSDNTMILHEPVRPGDVISHHQVLRSISDPKTTKLGTGRFWVIDVEYHNQNGELVGVESYTGFGYKRTAPSTSEVNS